MSTKQEREDLLFYLRVISFTLRFYQQSNQNNCDMKLDLTPYSLNSDRISAVLRDLYTDSLEDYEYPWQYCNNK